MVWAKGQSGNPAGLTILQARTKRAIDGLSLRAVARLEKLVDSDNEAIALGAIKEVLGRTNPMPKQANIAVQVTHTDAHLMALKQLADKTRERMTIDITPNSQTTNEVIASEASEPINLTEGGDLIGTQLVDMIDESDVDVDVAETEQ